MKRFNKTVQRLKEVVIKLNYVWDEQVTFGGEIHYFRLDKNDWGDRILKAKDAGLSFVSTYVPWSFHEEVEGQFDFENGNHNLREFVTLCRKHGLKCVLKPGPYVMSELVEHGLPLWMRTKYPQFFAKDRNGKIHPVPVVSYLHPGYLEKVRLWYQKFFEQVKDFIDDGTIPIIQLDNEVGMFHWITGTGDFSEVTIDHFREFLKKTYDENDLENLFGSKSLDEVVSKLLEGDEIATIVYMDFSRQYFSKYIERLKSFMNELGVNIPVYVNVHGFDQVDYAKRGANYPIGISQLLEAGKGENILTGDYYIGNVVHENFSDLVIANIFMQAVLERKPLTSLEFQSGFQIDKPKLLPSTIKLTTGLCLAMGMKLINYYMFAGGKNPKNLGLIDEIHDWQAPISYNGKLRKSYTVIKELINQISQTSNDLFNSEYIFDMYFGFIPSYFKTEFLKSGEMKNKLEHQRKRYIFEGLLRAFILENYKFSGLNLESENLCTSYDKPILVFSTEYMPEKVQQNLVTLVQNGANVVIYPFTPDKDEFGRRCTILQDFIGIRSKDFGTNELEIDERKIGTDFTTIFEVEGNIKPFAFNKGRVVGFNKKLSKGSITVFGVGFGLENEYKKFVCNEIAKEIGLERNFEVESDEFVDVYLRRTEKSHILFILNYDDHEKRVTVKRNGKTIFNESVDGRGLIIKKLPLEG